MGGLMVGVSQKNVESGPTKDHFSSNFSAADLHVIFFWVKIYIIDINKLKQKRTDRSVC
jgi:hypothetical protein